MGLLWAWKMFHEKTQGKKSCDTFPLKVHKHEIIWNFFLNKIKSLYALRKFSKKISLIFLRFSPDFHCSNISAVTEHTRNQIFLMSYPKNFFLLNLHYGPMRWFPRRFLKISIIDSQNLHFNLVFLSIFRKL
jgi:hypothetical protein